MIPTAEEWLKINYEANAINPNILIEFAKLHVERCKCEIEWVTSDIQYIYPLREEDLDFEKIYPLTNIK